MMPFETATGQAVSDAGSGQGLEYRSMPAAQDQRSVRNQITVQFDRQRKALMRTAIDIAGDLSALAHNKAVEEGLADLQDETPRAGVSDLGVVAQGHARRCGPDTFAFAGGRGLVHALRQCRSALSGRDSRFSIIASTVVSPFNRAATAREIGMSTPIFVASSRTAGALS